MLRRCFVQSKLLRLFSTTVSSSEIRVPVPHGHIAAKVWGSPEKVAESAPSRRLLAVHGWQDNANSFDPLVKHTEHGLHNLLTRNGDGTCLVSIDFSGHGLSSHLPPGSLYTHQKYGLDIAAVANYLNWENFSLIGHSLGGGIAFYFSLMCPHRVAKFVSIDGTFVFWQPSYFFESVAETSFKAQEKFNEDFVKNGPPPQKEFSMEEYLAAVRGYNAVMFPDSPEGSTSRENQILLLERGSKATSDGKFVLTRDPRVRDFFPEMSGATLLSEYLSRFVGTGFQMLVFMPDKGNPMYQGIYEMIEQNRGNFMGSFEIVHVENATHHVHMNEPEKILPKLTDFLLRS